MSTPRALILRTAGTNCDAETERALRLAGAETELLHWNRLLANPGALSRAEIVVFPGGFSYGDDVAAGRVFGLDKGRTRKRQAKHHRGQQHPRSEFLRPGAQQACFEGTPNGPNLHLISSGLLL